MPTRMIREGLLDSQRYWSVTGEARQLFVHMMLIADDFGLLSLAPVFIRRRCFDDAPSQPKIDKQIEQLHDADLLRVYESDGTRYGFIPRFRQTLRIEKAKCPIPPPALYEDDEHAKDKFIKNKDKFKKCDADAAQMQSRRHAEVELKRKEKEVELKTGNGAHQEVKGYRQRAAEIGLSQLPDEPEGAYQARVLQALERQRNRS